MKGERDEAGEVIQARRQWGVTKGFKQGSGLVREGWRLGWRGSGQERVRGWETIWEATEMVASTGSGQWEWREGWGSRDIFQVEWPGIFQVMGITVLADPPFPGKGPCHSNPDLQSA